MKFSFKFSNLLGTIYRQGNVLFSPDGNSILSPVGNRITVYDLKSNVVKTLSVESKYNYTAMDLSPDGCILVAVNEEGEAQMISMISYTVMHTYKFSHAVTCVKFSPDGQYFAISKENMVFVFKTPGEVTGEYNYFVLKRYFHGVYDKVTSIDWSSDSRLLAIGTRDNSIKICSVEMYKNFRPYILGGHSEPIVGCFFEKDSLHLNTISQNGQLCLWECSVNMEDLEPMDNVKRLEPLTKRRKDVDADDNFEKDRDLEGDVEDAAKSKYKSTDDASQHGENGTEERDEQGKIIPATQENPFRYKKLARHFLGDEARKENRNAILSAVAYHPKSRLLITAFSTGVFYLYELPDASLIHSLNTSENQIDTVCFNSTGDWIALGIKSVGQLLVWEWQSEQYVLKQQGHTDQMNCIDYSPDGLHIASGGGDGKIKLWNVQNGFCFVTFSEHTSSVTSLQFSQNKKFLVSASLDGTVRAYDLIRYRNFRTFTSPRPVQFSCVAIDYSGELVVAGGQDVFEIYLWSMKIGKLLEILSGHEGPVSSVAFAPSSASSTLISGSWDKSVKIWNCLENSSVHETVDVASDVLCVAFKPNGQEFAVATLNGNLSVFTLKNSQQLYTIEGRNDLGSGKSEIDIIKAKTNLQGKAYTSITFSADGECILAGGKSKNVCIYHVEEGVLLKKFEITQNFSFDGMEEYINRRKMTEWGHAALIEERETLEGGNVKHRLPGVQKGDMASRSFKPEVNVFDLRFSPTSQSWAAATTEGLLVYSLDRGIVFDPFHLSFSVTPKAMRECLEKRNFSAALIMALKLNEASLVQETLEKVPAKEIELVAQTLPDEFGERLVLFVAKFLSQTQHIEFYLNWSCTLLSVNGPKDNCLSRHSLLALHQSMSNKYESLSKVCEFTKYTIRVIKGIGDLAIAKGTNSNGIDNGEDEDDDNLMAEDLLEHLKENRTHSSSDSE